MFGYKYQLKLFWVYAPTALRPRQLLPILLISAADDEKAIKFGTFIYISLIFTKPHISIKILALKAKTALPIG
jgi:hypothetical protein